MHFRFFFKKITWIYRINWEIFSAIWMQLRELNGGWINPSFYDHEFRINDNAS